MSLDEIWGIVKPILEFGIVGALLFMVIRGIRYKDSETKNALQELAKVERERGREMLALERDRNKELVELLRHYDELLSGVNVTLESLSAKINGKET